MCSVLFVDLVGFTPFSEDRDPEDVRELLLHYFDAVRTVVSRYGGVVEQFIGDAVVALWGAPRAREGDAERAVRAALDVVQSVGVLGADLEEAITARAGVVTGEVAVSFAAGGHAMIAGDAVNTAARIQATAEPGQVLVDEVTRRLAASAIAFADAGEHKLKGKSEPAQLWRTLRVVSGFAGSQRPDGLEGPLCGRDPELRALRDMFHACVDQRQANLVMVNGPAGVGKSRLGWELEKYVDGLAAKVLWHRGRCLSYGDGVAFWALAEMIRQRFGIAEEDPSDVAAEKLVEGLARFVGDPGERSYVAVRLGRLLGLPVEGDPGMLLPPDELYAGWRVFFERLAEVAPVVLVIEDAHYADPALLDFLDNLVDWAPNAPVFVVVLARAEFDLKRVGFGSGRNRTVLSLAPLDATSMGTLLEGLVPGLPAPAASAIAEQAQGVPLFAVETVRSLIDRAALIRVPNGGYRVVGEVGELAVPDSLHGLLAARLDALDQGVRLLVADASVLGTTFSAEGLIAVSGRPDDEVRAGLAELVRREVLQVSTDRLSPQRGDYRFAQEMLRQVACATLSRRDRKARHLAVAAYLRSTFADDGEEVMDVVARHYLDALEAVPGDADVGQLRELAVGALGRAAERAERAGAPGRAAALYESAAQLNERHHETGAAASLWEQAAAAWLPEADLKAAVDSAERARALYARLGDQRAAARASVLLGRALRYAGRHREARDHLEMALDVLRHEPAIDTVEALDQLAALDVFEPEERATAGRLIAEGLNLAQGLDVDDSLLADLLMLDGINCWMTNRPVEGAANFKEAAYLAERAGDTVRLAAALGNLSASQLARNPNEAATHAAAAAAHARRTGNRGQLAALTANLVIALFLLGDWDGAARELGDQAELDGTAELRHVPALRGWLSALRGHMVGAADVIGGLTELAVSENVQDRVILSTTRALSAAAANQPIEALAHASAALDHVEALGLSCDDFIFAWPIANDAATALGDRQALEDLLGVFDAHPVGHLAPVLRAERALAKAHLAAAGNETDSPGAEKEFVDAVAAFRRAGSPWHLGRALADYGAYLTAHGQLEAASAALDEARVIAERLGARPLARRIAAVRANEAQPATTGTLERDVPQRP